MKNENIVIIVITAVLAFFIIAGGFSGYGMMGYRGMMGSYWIFGPIIMVLVIIVLVLLILWLIKEIGERK